MPQSLNGFDLPSPSANILPAVKSQAQSSAVLDKQRMNNQSLNDRKSAATKAEKEKQSHTLDAKSPSKKKLLAGKAAPVEESAPKETIDAVYKEKDPISASLKYRLQEGSLTSIVHHEKK